MIADMISLLHPQRLAMTSELLQRCEVRRLQQTWVTYPCGQCGNPRSRAISIRCTSFVPSPISRTFASR